MRHLALAGLMLLTACGDDDEPHPGVTCPNGETVDLDHDPANCGACGNACPSGQTCNRGACECGGGETDCGGKCVDTASDPEHCGACSAACKLGEACIQGTCCIQSCGPGLQVCDVGGPCKVCADTQSDSEHCGGCNNACDGVKGFHCSGGTCKCLGTLVDCGGICVFTDGDPEHCGACNAACGGTESCVNGICVP